MVIGSIWLARTGGLWSLSQSPPPLSRKRPARQGPFKEAFRNRLILVWGTKGTPEENAWSLARARFDAETFWYRGNGSVDIVSDASLLEPGREQEFRDRNVILYGHADHNAAWRVLFGESPVQVRRGQVKFGSREISGDDLACLFIQPRPGSDRASVAAVSGSGLTGLRLTERLPYFTSGVAYPDCLVIKARRPARARRLRLLRVTSGRTGMLSQANSPGLTERGGQCENPDGLSMFRSSAGDSTT